MKKRKLILLFLALALSLCMCVPSVGTVELSQEREQIVSVELLYKPEMTWPWEFTPICRIEAEDQDRFLDDFQELEARWIFNDPFTDLGELVIRVTYQNGDVDLIGYCNNIRVQDGKEDYENWYFDEEEFKALFDAYAGEVMPENVFPWKED